MSPKSLNVTCPCCRAELDVDVLTAKVMTWRSGKDAAAPRKPAGERWDDLHGQVKGRVSDSAERLDSALEREKTKSKDLDRLFEDLHKKAKSRKPEGDG